jgi:membrane protease YdiL (CAAX protease family)
MQLSTDSDKATNAPRAWLVGCAAFICSLMFFSNVAVRPLFGFVNPRHPSGLFILGVAVGIATAATALSHKFPRWRRSGIGVLVATAFVFFSIRGIPVATDWAIRSLPLDSDQAYWCRWGPGGGLLLLLPSAMFTVAGGILAFGMSAREQWGGRLQMKVRDWAWGLGISLLWTGFALTTGALYSFITGEVVFAVHSDWTRYGADMTINMFSNLYEEILARGFLLQISRKYFGDTFAMLWTGIIFGLMHVDGDPGKAIFFCMFTWIIAVAVIRSGSLWSGWVVHQTSDMMIDSIVP